MKNKTFIMIIVVFIAVFLGIIFFKSGKKEIIISKDSPVVQEINLEEINLQEQQIREEVKNALNECEKDYQEGISKYSEYTRGDFYNETRLNLAMKETTLSFVTFEKIDKDKAYNVSGEKISELPDTIYDIDENDYIEDEKYYILRCTTNTDYIFYYIVSIYQNGISDLEWYCFTKNEDIEYEYNFEERLMPIENGSL